MTLLQRLAGTTFLAAIVSGMVTATLFAFLRGYLEKFGQNLATRQDVGFLQNQLKENTEITKSIEHLHTRADVLWRAELDFRERQLAEFYGPAYGFVKSEKHIYDLWREGKMSDVNFQVKKFFRDNNVVLRNLIISKAHLIDGSEMPDSFVRYSANSIVFNLFAVPTNDGNVPEELARDPRVEYPIDFDQHIIDTTERIKARIESLHKKYAQPLT